MDKTFIFFQIAFTIANYFLYQKSRLGKNSWLVNNFTKSVFRGAHRFYIAQCAYISQADVDTLTHTHTYTHTYTHTHTHTYTHTLTYTHTYTHTHTYIHTHTQTHTHTQIHMHTLTHILIYTYTIMHIHTHSLYTLLTASNLITERAVSFEERRPTWRVEEKISAFLVALCVHNAICEFEAQVGVVSGTDIQQDHGWPHAATTPFRVIQGYQSTKDQRHLLTIGDSITNCVMAAEADAHATFFC